MKLSELIIDYRKRMNISQREFSRKCDLSNTYISFLEREKNPKTGRPMIPTIEQYKKIADGMDITVQQLFEMLDEDAPVDLGSPVFVPVPADDQPKTDKINNLVRILNELPPEESAQAVDMFTSMFKLMFPKKDVFEKGNENDANT